MNPETIITQRKGGGLGRHCAGPSRYRVRRYSPRVEQQFARIERWTRDDGDTHWRTLGTRRDLDEAIAFAAEGKVRAEITKATLSDINAILARLKAGRIDGRVVLDLTAPIETGARKTEAAYA